MTDLTSCRPTARRNVGVNEQGLMFECPWGLTQANEKFVDLFMKRQIMRLLPPPVRSPLGPVASSNLPPSPNAEATWWIVPVGPNPGVYHGQ